MTASAVRQHPCNALLMFILQKVAPSHLAQQSMLAFGAHLTIEAKWMGYSRIERLNKLVKVGNGCWLATLQWKRKAK